MASRPHSLYRTARSISYRGGDDAVLMYLRDARALYNGIMNQPLESNVFKTALLFEGGSMRGAYTCAVAAYLLEKGIFFDNVYGVSSGSSNMVNYVSRDVDRVIRSFTDFVEMPDMMGWKTFLQGKGFFNAYHIYQEAGLPDGPLPFDFETFQANPAKATIISFERDTGRDAVFRKQDMRTLDDLMMRVRASSTLPVFMPPPCFDGVTYYDGGFATGGGLPLQLIDQDGFEKLFVVRTRRRGYRKPPEYQWAKVGMLHRPHLRRALLDRAKNYNEACDMLDEWERQGRAYVFYCDDLTLSGMESDYAPLARNFEYGYAQIQREWPQLMEFLEHAEA